MTLTTAPLFLCLPRNLLLRGPIRARNAPPKDGLSIAEFCLGAAAAHLARKVLNEERHRVGFKEGKSALIERRSKVLIPHPVWGPDEQFLAAGSEAYWGARARFLPNPNGYSIRTSARELYALARLSRNGDALALLPDALDRLCDPVERFPPALLGWRQLNNGRLRVRVSPEWLPTKEIARVPWPPPKRGEIILALYLFGCAANFRAENASIALDRLKPLISDRARSSSELSRNLDRALRQVNEHLFRFEYGALRANGFPEAFRLVRLEGGKRIAIQRHDATIWLDPAPEDALFAEEELIEPAERQTCSENRSARQKQESDWDYYQRMIDKWNNDFE